MWTGSRFRRRALIASGLLAIACQPRDDSAPGSDTPVVAWWLTATFAPTGTTVRGVDVRLIDTSWRRATALDTLELRKHVSPAQLREVAASPLSFSVTADLDRDGAEEDFFVGTFETVDGRTGRFVAITRGGRLIRHFVDEGQPGFSALVRDNAEVRWYRCLECDDFESIRWSGRSYVLE